MAIFVHKKLHYSWWNQSYFVRPFDRILLSTAKLIKGIFLLHAVFLFTFLWFFDFGVFHKIRRDNSVLRERLCKGGSKTCQRMLFIEKNDTEHQSFKYMHTLVTCINVFQQIPYVGPPGKPIEVCRKTSFCYECGIISLFT